MQPDFFRGEVEAGCKLLQVRVQPLGSDEQVDAAVGGRHREPGFGAERGLVLHAGLIRALHPHVGAGVRVTVDDLERAHDVSLRVDRRSGWLERLLHVGDRREHRVVHRDLFQGSPRQLCILGSDDGHRLAGVAYDVARQDGLVLDIEAERFLAGYVRRGQNGEDPGRRGGGGDVDRHDPGVRVGAAEGGPPEHAIAAQVAGVLELALHLGDAVDPAHRLTDPPFSTDLDAHWICTPPTPTLPRKGGGRCFKVTRWPSRTTGFPSTKRCFTGPELQNTRAATGSDSAPRWARSSTAKRATSARFPTSSEPMSSRPRQAAPPRVATRSAWRAVMAAGPFRALVVSKAWRVSASRLPLSFEAEPSTARPTATPASMSSRVGANPEPSRMFDVGHQATAVRVEAIRLISAGARCTQWASQTSGPRKSRSSRSSSGRRSKVWRQNSSSSSVSAMCVCSRTFRLRASATDSRISGSDTENGEQGPTAIRSIDPGAGSWNRWIASSVAERIRSTSSTTESGGRPPRDWPRSIDPRQGWKRKPRPAATSISASRRPVIPAGKT